jgi:hypothetical protein
LSAFAIALMSKITRDLFVLAILCPLSVRPAQNMNLPEVHHLTHETQMSRVRLNQQSSRLSSQTSGTPFRECHARFTLFPLYNKLNNETHSY